MLYRYFEDGDDATQRAHHRGERRVGHGGLAERVAGLAELAEHEIREVRRDVREYQLGDGRRINLFAEGRLVNLGAAEGHPAAVMDMSFAGQALSAEYVVRNHRTLEPRVYVVPEEIDAEVARLKLAALGVTIDTLTPEQVEYMGSWQHGT